MAKKPMPFEKSKYDKEPKGMKESSKGEKSLDVKMAKRLMRKPTKAS